MKIYTIKQAQSQAPGQIKEWLYNALDVTGTAEIAEALLPRLNADPLLARTYAFERAAQGPAFAMTMRGIAVDEPTRKEAVRQLKLDFQRMTRAIQKRPDVVEIWDGLEKETGVCLNSTRKDGKHTWEKGVPDGPDRKCTACGQSRFKRALFNPNSAAQAKHLFFDLYHIKPIRNKTGEISVDKETLLKISEKYPHLAELALAIREAKGIKKQIGFLDGRLTPEGRFPSTFNVGAAWTGRWSSSENAFGQGSNAQNITEKHRHIFISDPGYLIAYGDLKQGESKAVAYMSGDEQYIKAHDEGDTHTYVTRLVWPEYAWTGDIEKDKKLASSILPEWDNVPGHDLRFQSKKVQHGSNYGLSAFGMGMIEHIPTKAAREAQARYFNAFPGIPAWQKVIKGKVVNQEALISPLGRKVKLFGRPDDDHTYRQGLSLLPQGIIGDIINIALWLIWTELEPKEAQLLAQVHDAALAQLLSERPDIARRVLELMRVPIPVTDINGVTRTMTIDSELAIGKNWGKYKADKNPNGIKEFHG